MADISKFVDKAYEGKDFADLANLRHERRPLG